jgi:hypothetical protein
MAIRTLSITGGSYNVASTWVENAVPNATDDVIFSGNSGNLIITSGALAKSVNFGSYSGTVTFNNALTVSGNVNLGNGNYIQSGTTGIIINTNSTLASNGVVWSLPLTFSNATINLNGVLNLNNTLTTQTGAVILSGSNINLGGNLVVNNTTSGTANIFLNGTGSQTWSSTSYLGNNLIINKPSGVLYTSGSVYYQTNTLTYSAGTVVTTGSTLDIGSSCNLNTNGINWNNFTCDAINPTINLLSNLNIGGSLNLASVSPRTVIFTGSSITTSPNSVLTLGNTNYSVNAGNSIITFPSATTLNCSNLNLKSGGASGLAYNLTLNNANLNVYGNLAVTWINQATTTFLHNNSQINVVGTGTITTIGTGNGSVTIPLAVNTTGTTTFSGSIYHNTGAISYSAGTVVTTGSTLVIGSSTVLDPSFGSILWDGLNLTNTMTLNGHINVNNLTTNATTTLNGLYNVNVYSNFTNSTTNGTSKIILNGTSNQSWSSSGYLSNDLTVNKVIGNLNLGTNIYYQTGTLTYSAGTVITTGSTLTVGTSALLNTNGINWNNFTCNDNSTINLLSNLNVTGSLNLASTISRIITFSGSPINTLPTTNLNFGAYTFNSANASNVVLTFPSGTTLNCNNLNLTAAGVTNGGYNTTLNNANLNVYGNLAVTWINQNISIFNHNNGQINMVGTGSITTSGNGTGQLRVPITINNTGTTFFSGIVYYNTTLLKYVSGNVVSTGSTLFIGASTPFDISGTSLNNITFASGTQNLISGLNVSGTLLNQTSTITFSGSNVNVLGNFVVNSLTNGNSLININGSGNQVWSGSSTLNNNLIINKPSGNLNVNGDVYYNTGTLTHNSGTVNTTNGSLYVLANTSLNTSGITWYDFRTWNTTNLNLSSNLNLTNFYVNYKGSIGDNLNTNATSANIIFSGSGNLNISDTLYMGYGGYSFAIGNASFPTILNLPSSITVPNLKVRLSGSRNAQNQQCLHNTTINNQILTVTNSVEMIITSLGSSWADSGNLPSINGTTQLLFKGNSWTARGDLNNTPGTTGMVFTYNIPITIDTVGVFSASTNITTSNASYPSNTFYFNNNKISYLSGSINNVNNATLRCTSSTIDLNTFNWGNISLVGNTTLLSNLNTNNLSTDITTVNFLSGNSVNVNGDLSINTTTNGTTTPINLIGSNNQTWTHGSAFYLGNNTTINKSGGTLTIGPNIYYQTGLLSYSAGTVNTTLSSSTLNVGSCSLATGGINWYNFNTSLTSNVALINNLTWTNLWSSTAGSPIVVSSGGTLTPASTARINFTGTANVTTPASLSGYTFSAITITSSNATTLGGDLVCGGLLTLGTGAVATTINGSNRRLITNGGMTIGATTGYIVGTAIVKINGGNINSSGSLSGGYFQANLEIDGNVTFTSGNTFYFYGGPSGTGSFNYISGNVTTTGSNLWFNSCILNSGGIPWNNVWFIAGNSVPTTLVSDVTVNGLLTLGYLTASMVINSSGVTKTIIASSGLTMSGSNGVVSGTATVRVINGTINGGSSVQLRNNLELAGNVVFTNGVTFNYNTGVLKYVSGTTTTTNTTLNIGTTTTMETSGVTWNNITFGGGTVTMNNPLVASGLMSTTTTLTLNGADTYANGGFNFTSTAGNVVQGNSLIRFEGSGSWLSSGGYPNRGTYRSNVLINPTGNLSIDIYYCLGTISYSKTNGGRVTSASMSVGYPSPSNIGASRSINLDTNEMRWNLIYMELHDNLGAPNHTTITCLSDVSCNFWQFANIGASIPDTINFTFLNNSRLINTGYFYINARARVNFNTLTDFTTEYLYFQTLTNYLVNANITVTKSLVMGSYVGAGYIANGTNSTIIMENGTSWLNNDQYLFTLDIPVIFKGDISIGTKTAPIYYGRSISFNGNPKKTAIANGWLYLTTSASLTNFNKITFNRLTLTAGSTITMNEFFGGTVSNIGNIESSSNVSNFNVTFTDNYEKYAKFVSLKNCTVTRPGQLTVLTNKANNLNLSGNSSNSGIIFYPNQKPNGFAKNNPSSQNQQSYDFGGILPDPIFK